MARRKVPEGQKTVYYTGMALSTLGLILFASFFVSVISNVAEPGRDAVSNMATAAVCAFVGFGLILVGGVLWRMGLLGLTGAGMILDPKRARKETEPSSRMADGTVRNALEAAQVNLGKAQPQWVPGGMRCGACGKPNDRDARFCKNCGEPLCPPQP